MKLACWKKIFRKVALPIFLKYEVKSDPVATNNDAIIFGFVSCGNEERSGSLFKACIKLLRCTYRFSRVLGGFNWTTNFFIMNRNI